MRTCLLVAELVSHNAIPYGTFHARKIRGMKFPCMKMEILPPKFPGMIFSPKNFFFIGNWVVLYLIHGIHFRGNIFIFMHGNFIFMRGSFIFMHGSFISMPQSFHA